MFGRCPCVYLGLEGRMVMAMRVEAVIQKQGDDGDHNFDFEPWGKDSTCALAIKELS